MRRFVLLVFLLVFFIPASISIVGCSRNKSSAVYCNGGDSGLKTGQITNINLEPRLVGVSLSNGQIGNIGAASATDCKGSDVGVSSYTYASSDVTHTIADVDPTTGRICAGAWNRNTPGGIANYTFCNNTGLTGTATITASSGGATSNAVTVYVHPIIGSVQLATSLQTDCVSQGKAITLSASAFDTNGTLIPPSLVGKLTFAPVTAGIVTIDENGVATAQSPGSTLITASVSSATSTAGYFSTCPPQKITLAATGTSSNNITVNPNTTQPITATVTDKNGTTLTNLTLTFVSTTPTTIPAANGSVTPLFPGAGAITAFCQPPTCNSSSSDRLGLFGNGKPIASNNINVTTSGLSSTYLYMASTQSQYISQIDLTTGNIGGTLRLPYVPNSMVLSTDGTTLYLGSGTELMVVTTATTSLSREDQSVVGKVISVSPNSATAVITDPTRKLIYLYSSAGVVSSTFGGVATRAAWSPDSTTVYIITADNQLITHSDQNGWQTISNAGLTTVNDVAVTVPSVGAYFAGSTGLVGHSYCHKTTYTTTGTPAVTSIEYFPVASGSGSIVAAPNERIAATNDGQHILGSRILAGVPQFTDVKVTLPINDCPTASGATASFALNSLTTQPATGATGTAITGIYPASDSSIAFTTYSLGATASPVLPSYRPSTGVAANVSLVTASGSPAPTAPVSGVFSSNDSIFFTGTSGDNLVHLVTKQSSGAYIDASQVNPKLPALTGTGFAVPDLLAQYPRSFR